MDEQRVHFFSDDLRLEGSFYFPDNTTSERKVFIVACSGFMGLKNIHPLKFARSLTQEGYPCFGFDYRGFAQSEGIQGRVILDEQIRDIVNAVSFAASDSRLSDFSPVLLGWGMGGGLVLESARLIASLAGVASVNGFYNGRRVQQAVRGEEGFRKFEEWLAAERSRGSRERKKVKVDPFFLYPLDPVTKSYVNSELEKNPDFGGNVDFSLADSLLRFVPEAHLEELQRIPLLVVHGTQNHLHPRAEADSLYSRYPGPKHLYWLENAGHTEWMYEGHPQYLELIRQILLWLENL